MDAEKEIQKDTPSENQKFITDVEEIIDPEKKKIREEEEREAKERAKKRKLIPPLIMLSAGAIVSITMFVQRYEAKDMLLILLCVLIVFYIAGELVKWMFDRFEAQIEAARLEEGEVIEKEPDESFDANTHEGVTQSSGDTEIP
ncbi:MAG: hypothetical protein NC433_06695 [Clostridiales bacterium]|nr:hypothetical protein [Clostridiales bacterium]